MEIGVPGLFGGLAARHVEVEPKQELGFATTQLQLTAEQIALVAHQNCKLATLKRVQL